MISSTPKPELGPPTCYCPACARPFWSAELYQAHYEETHGAPTRSSAPEEQEVTVQNVYSGKNLQIVGVILMVIGIPTCFSGSHGSYSDTGGVIGGVIGAAGLACFIAGRFIHWYHAE